MFVTRNLLAHYRGSEIHNELLHDESAAFAVDRRNLESDHAPVIAKFEFDQSASPPTPSAAAGPHHADGAVDHVGRPSGRRFPGDPSLSM
jgi:hypothetical protein